MKREKGQFGSRRVGYSQTRNEVGISQEVGVQEAGGGILESLKWGTLGMPEVYSTFLQLSLVQSV